MNKKKLLILNRFSGISFFISSVCLLTVPFLNISNGLTVGAYIIASLFWIGFLIGIGCQIFINVKCKKMDIKRKWKNRKIFYIIAAIALLILIIFAAVNVNNIFFAALLLFISIISLELSAVIEKERCLK